MWPDRVSNPGSEKESMEVVTLCTNGKETWEIYPFAFSATAYEKGDKCFHISDLPFEMNPYATRI